MIINDRKSILPEIPKNYTEWWWRRAKKGTRPRCTKIRQRSRTIWNSRYTSCSLITENGRATLSLIIPEISKAALNRKMFIHSTNRWSPEKNGHTWFAIPANIYRWRYPWMSGRRFHELGVNRRPRRRINPQLAVEGRWTEIRHSCD